MKRYRSKYLFMIITVGLLMTTLGILAFVYTAMCQQTADDALFFFAFAIFGVVGFLGLLQSSRRAFSWFSFTGQGILNTCFGRKDIIIRWNECEEIGIGLLVRGYGLYTPCIYFSKLALTQKQVTMIQNVNFSENTIWIQYSKEIIEEVLKYIPEERISNKQLIPEKEWFAWLSPPNSHTPK